MGYGKEKIKIIWFDGMGVRDDGVLFWAFFLCLFLSFYEVRCVIDIRFNLFVIFSSFASLPLAAF